LCGNRTCLILRELPVAGDSYDDLGVTHPGTARQQEFSMHFFVLTALARKTDSKAIPAAILEGDLRRAFKLAQAEIESCRDAGAHAGDADVALRTADLMLALDLGEDAESTYRQAVKSAALGERGQVRVVSCRTTGFMSLYRRRFGTAMSCFRRMADDDASTDAQRLEALCGLALAYRGVGLSARAIETLGAATTLADALAQAQGTAWATLLVDVLRAELHTEKELLMHGALHDHVFWQETSSHATAEPQAHARFAIEAALSTWQSHPFVARRLGHLQALLRMTAGQVSALGELRDGAEWLHRRGLIGCERQARIETALCAIIAGDANAARLAVEPLCGRHGDAGCGRGDVELSYCMAKVCELGGRPAESLKHYQRYALESVQCVRTEVNTQAGAARAREADALGAAKDDVEMRLPAKYRRGYRYLLQHLASATLSVREIAEDIGVTERAVQLMFKTQLGMTPVEIIRRCRIERIHEELLRGDTAGVTVFEVAARWGIRNRSTLVSVYRKHFNETPGQTLSRCHAAASGHDELSELAIDRAAAPSERVSLALLAASR
jgi:AraC-like DNA-binding protein